MNTNDLILNASAIVLRIISHLKYISSSKQFNKENFNKIYSNDDVWKYLDLFLNNKKLYKQINFIIRQIRRGFNVGMSIGFDEPFEIWDHSYRHWSFIPKEHEIDNTRTKHCYNTENSPVQSTK